MIGANSTTYNKNQVLRGDNNHNSLLLQLSLEDKLLQIPHKYYIYNFTNDLLPTPLGDAKDRNKRYWLGVVLSIYDALLSHPLRTLNPEEATFFIPPVFPNQVNPFLQAKSQERQKFMKALDVVLQSEIYQSTRGSRHIFLVLDGWHLNWNVPYGGLDYSLKRLDPEWMNSIGSLWDNGEKSGLECFDIHHTDPWKGEYRECWPYSLIFKNTILARDRDMWALRGLWFLTNQSTIGSNNCCDEFLDLVKYHDPIPNFGFSLGLLLMKWRCHSY